MYSVRTQQLMRGNCPRCNEPLAGEACGDGLAEGYTEDNWMDAWPNSVVPVHQRCWTPAEKAQAESEADLEAAVEAVREAQEEI